MKDYTVTIMMPGSANRITVSIKANSPGLAVDAAKKMYPNCIVIKVN